MDLIAVGTVPATAMFKAAPHENAALTWIVRAIGDGLMFMGFGLILRSLGVLGDVVRAGAGFVGLVCTAPIAPLVIAIGWLWHRPPVGIAILLAGPAATYGLLWLVRPRSTRRAPA